MQIRIESGKTKVAIGKQAQNMRNNKTNKLENIKAGSDNVVNGVRLRQNGLLWTDYQLTTRP